MRVPIPSLVVAFVALAGGVDAASAQTPYSYPWCAKIITKSVETSCYYATKELCTQTISGVGGFCYQNPAYRGPAARAARAVHKRR
jgi:hypothetical protein